MLNPFIVHYVSLFLTLLAIINPLEAIPVFLNLMADKDRQTRRRVARKSCLYAMGLMAFFLLFGTLVMEAFGVWLSMVQVVGGIILTRIGFELFAPSQGRLIPAAGSQQADDMDMSAGDAHHVRAWRYRHADRHGSSYASDASHPGSLCHRVLALSATMVITYLSLAYAGPILKKIGPKGIDAASRITGFFV